MRFALFCSAALLAAPVMAEELVASIGGDSVRLSDSQCANEKVLEQFDPGMRSQLKHAIAVLQGQSLEACWITDGKVAHLVYEDGDVGLVPLSEFKKSV